VFSPSNINYYQVETSEVKCFEVNTSKKSKFFKCFQVNTNYHQVETSEVNCSKVNTSNPIQSELKSINKILKCNNSNVSF